MLLFIHLTEAIVSVKELVTYDFFVDSSMISGASNVNAGTIIHCKSRVSSTSLDKVLCYEEHQCFLSDISLAVGSVPVNDPVRCFVGEEALVANDREF